MNFCNLLVQRGNGYSRKRTAQGKLTLLRCDYDLYESIFNDKDVFGDTTFYQFAADRTTTKIKAIDYQELPSTNFEERARATEVWNLAALRDRRDQGVHVTEERNPHALSSLISCIEDHAEPVGIEGINLSTVAESDTWAVHRPCTRRDHFGRIYEEGFGIQKVTRETRLCGHERFMVVEIDMVAAMYQIFLFEIKSIVTAEEFMCDYAIVRKFVTKSSQWKHAAAA